MKNELNMTSALNAFNQVVKLGTKNDGIYRYQHIEAWHDFDGYTCYLKACGVTLSLLFHGKYHIDYQQPQQLNDFMSLIDKLSVKGQLG
ncbi:DUF3081 family protein [Shewanella waksmanii]|uniref:DUF3081 family protein n=2 Tax=Shewanella TaxID=22 RepID=UPI00048E5CB5|nr:DUF3081 family protein [Shewanella waksmanii]